MKLVTLMAALAFVGMHQLDAATAPYANDFSGTGGNTAFTVENLDADWTVTGGVYQFSSNNTSYTASTASIAVTNMSGMAFTMQTQFTVTSPGTVNANGGTIGFGLFGATTTFAGSSAGTSYYLADFQYGNSGTPGNLRIIALGDTAGATSNQVNVDDNAGTSSLAVNIGTVYTLKLQGSYTGSTLNMTLGLFDAVGTNQIGTSATMSDTSVLTGTNFGYRNRIGLSGGTATVDYDNFSITIAAVPEPGSVALLMGGLAAMSVVAARRRR